MPSRILYWDAGELFVAYRKSEITKVGAWRHLSGQPPDFLGMSPGVSSEKNPYLTAHLNKFWRWKLRAIRNPENRTLFIDENGNLLDPITAIELISELAEH